MPMPTSDWKVLGPRLLVRPIDPNQGAAIVRVTVDDGSGMLEGQECEVVGIGEDWPWSSSWVDFDSEEPAPKFTLGQRVIVARYKGCKVELAGEELLVVDVADDVLLVKEAAD